MKSGDTRHTCTNALKSLQPQIHTHSQDSYTLLKLCSVTVFQVVNTAVRNARIKLVCEHPDRSMLTGRDGC